MGLEGLLGTLGRQSDGPAENRLFAVLRSYWDPTDTTTGHHGGTKYLAVCPSCGLPSICPHMYTAASRELASYQWFRAKVVARPEVSHCTNHKTAMESVHSPSTVEGLSVLEAGVCNTPKLVNGAFNAVKLANLSAEDTWACRLLHLPLDLSSFPMCERN